MHSLLITDNFDAPETRLNTIRALNRNKIPISPTKETETNIPYDRNYKLDGYRITTAAEKKVRNKKNPGTPVGGDTDT